MKLALPSLVVRSLLLRPFSTGMRAVLAGTAVAALALSAGAQGQSATGHVAGLPNACAVTVAACKGQTFIGAAGAGSTMSYGANSLTVHQAGSTAIFNWQDFNISAGNVVNFVQPGNSSVALNRIYDPNVTNINGKLTANGQIYLINPNGILFGNSAVVDVGGIIASTLDLNDNRVLKGFLYDPTVTDPVFSSNPAHIGTSSATSPTASAGATPAITVLPGASIYAAGQDQSGTVVSAGRVFLFAPNVEVGGNIQVDGGGQAIIASGSDVYLGSSTDPSLRGLLVEVSAATAADGVKVDATGNISVSRGNVTLMGLAVDQAGTVQATSALDDNGSIRLIARVANPASTTYPTDTSVLIPSLATGKVTIESGSTTRVVLDTTDTSTAPLNDATAASMRSKISIEGSTVDIGGSGAAGSTVLEAHGGDISITARLANSSDQSGAVPYGIGDGSLLGAKNTSAVINVGSDALIDTSGLQDVAVDGARNFVYIDRLTSNNLADAPFQRTGFLLGQGVYLNLATAPSWIDTSNLKAAVAGTQAERNSVGGTVALLAEGAVNLATGSVVNVSGGSTNVSAAVGRTTQLVTAGGAVVDISKAGADTRYVGFADSGSSTVSSAVEGINVSSSWQMPRYTQVGGYVQGSNAGTVEIYAPSASLGGSLLGSTITSSISQRSSAPLGGQIRIGSDPTGQLDMQAGFSRPDIVIGDGATAIQQTLASMGNPNAITLDSSTFVKNGFTRLDLTSDGSVVVAAGSDLDLGPQGQIGIRANSVSVLSSIVAPGGSVSISERPVSTSVPGTGDAWTTRDSLNLVNPAQRGLVTLGNGVGIDVAGTWTNDTVGAGLAANSPIVLNGGSISISGRTVDVSSASFDVSAGAWLSGNGSFQGGSAGSLSLGASNLPAALPGTTNTPSLVNLGVLDLGQDFASRIVGYGVSAGGSLSISAPNLVLGSGPALVSLASGAPAAVNLDPAVGATGFQTFKFGAYESVSLSPRTIFAPEVELLTDNTALNQTASNASLVAVAPPQAPLAGQVAPAASISLSASSPYDALVGIGAGSSIQAGPKGKISLGSQIGIDVAGALSAPGGQISIALSNPNPAGLTSLAALAARSVTLESGALVDVSGLSEVVQNAQGVRSGNVLAGGSISLDATYGALNVDAGSTVAARGATDLVDFSQGVSGYSRQAVSTAGGSIEMSAMTSGWMDGTLDAHGGDSTVAGGRFSFSMLAPQSQYTSVGAGLVPSAAVAARFALPEDVYVGFGISSVGNVPVNGANQGRIDSNLISRGGFDQVWIQSADRISFGGPVSLAARQSLALAAPSIGLAAQVPGTVALQAPYVLLGPAQLLATQGTAATASSSVGGSNNAQPVATVGSGGTLDVTANQIDLVGNLSLVNVAQANLSATGVVQGIGVVNPAISSARSSGTLSFAGNLNVDASAVIPSSMSDYHFTSVADSTFPTGGTLTLTASSATTPVPDLFSAGGSLDFHVANFVSSGRAVAPQGGISIEASNTITLEPGSLLSSAGYGVVPLGSVVNSSTWIYNADLNQSDLTPWTLASAAGVKGLPRGVSLTGTVINAQAGAVVDVGGGGDVLGTGFIPGPGGSYNMSLNFPYTTASGAVDYTQRNPYFALVPVNGTPYAPYDSQIFANLALNPALASGATLGLQVGQTITIAAGSAIPTGTYLVLPPAYALLQGAYAILPASGYSNMAPGTSVAMPDGTQIVAGKIGSDLAGSAATQWSGYRVYTDAQFRTLSEFQTFYGSQFFPAAATAAGVPLPRVGPDAGSLSVDATGSILLEATLFAPAQSGGRGASIAIDAPSIVVQDSSVSPISTPTAPQAQLVLDSLQLDALNAETLVLGGVVNRTGGGAGLGVSAASNSVTLAPSSNLSAGEVLLVGADVSVGSGAGVSAQGDGSVPTNALALNGDVAALYVGAGSTLPTVTRAGGSAVGTATQGSLEIGSQARISGGSVVFSAVAGQSYAADMNLQAGNFSLSAARINLGSPAAGTPGLNLDASLLSTFSRAGSLTLGSLGGFDVYGSAQLGAMGTGGVPTLGHLTLVGPGISAFGAGGSVGLTAGEITLDNSAGASVASTGTGSAALSIQAIGSSGSAGIVNRGNIEVAGNIALTGLASAALSSTGIVVPAQGTAAAYTTAGTGDLVFNGRSGGASSITVAGSPATTLTVAATRVTAQSGVAASITVPGSFTLDTTGPASPAQAAELGASLQVSAQSAQIDGRIDLPAGVVQIDATGTASTDSVHLGSGAVIRVEALTANFGSTTASASAGSLTLASASGSVVLDAGSTLDLSGTAGGGDAGSLSLLAPAGSVQLAGQLLLGAASGARGASVRIDGNGLDLSGLTGVVESGRTLDTAGTLSSAASLESVDVRSRTGNLSLDSGSTLHASNILIEADGGAGVSDGSVTIAGTLDASGSTGGRIAVYANNQIDVQSGAKMDVSAQGAGQSGGNILLSARVTAAAGASTALDAITLDPNASLLAQGGAAGGAFAAGNGGVITLRTNAVGASSSTGADVEIAALPVSMLQASGARELVVQGVMVDDYVGDLTIDAALQNTLAASLDTYMSAANRAGMSSRLLGGVSLPGFFSLQPGLELDATGSITIADSWDFATGLAVNGSTQSIQCAVACTWRYGSNQLALSDPGALTLRAGGSLYINANLSDGFLPTAATATLMNTKVWQSSAGESWSYVLTAGSDLQAANPNRTGGSVGDLVVGAEYDAFGNPVASTVRTGTGSISLNASEDVILNNGTGVQGSVVYTAGLANIGGLPAFASFSASGSDTVGNTISETVTPVLARNGGDLTIWAGRDVQGTSTDQSNLDGSLQAVNDWLFRSGTGGQNVTGISGSAPTVWWVQYDQFQQGFGALGGGNLQIDAGRDIVRVGAVVPSVGTAQPATGTQEFNSGTLQVVAGGNIVQGLYYDEAGSARVQATAFTANPQSAYDTVRFAQGSSTLDVQARLSSVIDLPFNPTSVDAATMNVASSIPAITRSNFFTYGAGTEFSARVTAGDLSLEQNQSLSYWVNTDATLDGLVSGNWQVLPPSVSLVTFAGGQTYPGLLPGSILYPQALGQLEVLASGDINGAVLQMSQADPLALGTPLAPVYNAYYAGIARLQVPLASSVGLHAQDPAPAMIVSSQGSIDGVQLILPKTADVVAAGNVGPNVTLDIQNSNSGMTSLVSAGDTLDLSGRAAGFPAHVYIEGSGAAEILSGGPMNLGVLGAGIEARGNFDNANLAPGAATLVVAAGTGRDGAGLANQPDYLGVIQNFVRFDAFAAAGSASSQLDAQVIADINNDTRLGSAGVALAQALTNAMANRGSIDDPASAVNAAIAALTPAQLVEAGNKMASSIQVVNNQQFVASANKDTFAPAYVAFSDLFPTLAANATVLASFAQSNPFAAASNGSQLQAQALQGLPAPLAAALQLALANPASVSDPASAYSKAIAAIDPATLEAGTRQLFANVLSVAGSSLDTLKANGQLTGSGSPYAKALTALAAAFSPRTLAGLNDLQMDYNQVKVDQSGSVAIFDPQGSVIVGQSAAQSLASGIAPKSATDLGIFTLGGGDIIGMVRDDFDVYRSRVFTVAGGDIDLWSSLGNLDAGRGPRDVAVAAPPRVVTDPTTGLQYLDFSAAVSGSGIGALKTQANQPPSNINLMAPAGYVDAGEAGIRAESGTVTLGTNIVLNAGNIQAASGVSGGAVVAAAPPPPPAAANSSSGEKALEEAQREVMGQQAAEQRALNQQRMRVVGEFLGYGEKPNCNDKDSFADNPDCNR